MKDMQLVIPTHARPFRQITLQALPQALRRSTIVVTSTEQDAADISRHYGHPASKILVSGSKTIADKRHWIMQNVQARCIFMMDDDIVFFRRCAPALRTWNVQKGQWDVQAAAKQRGITLMEQAAEVDFVTALAALESAVQLGYAAVAIAHRMHNNRVRESWLYCARMMYAFGVVRSVYLKEKLNFAEVQCREDFNVTLRLLRRGYANAVYCDFMTDPRAAFNSTGGASTTRTVEQSNSEAEKLAALHPGLVKVVDKTYKGSLHRREVIVQWKQAAKEGERYAR